MKPVTSVPRWRALVMPPRFLLGLVLALLAVAAGSAWFELNNQKREIRHLMHEEAAVLLQALALSAENAISAYNELKDQLAQRLLNNLRLLEQWDRRQPLTSADLARFAATQGLHRLNLFDVTGNRIASSHAQEHTDLPPRFDPRDQLAPLLAGEADSLIFGLRPSRFEPGARFAVAVARGRGGALVANVDAAELLHLRRRLGVGRLIQDVGASISGIAYIVLQDTSAILSATANVTDMEALQDDPFLFAAQQTDSVRSRFTSFAGRTVLEVVKPFFYEGVEIGLFRVGLRTDHLDEALARLRRRFTMLAALVFVGGLVLANLFVARQNESMLQRAYERIAAFSAKILEGMADAVIAVDAAGRVTRLNRAAERLFAVSFTQASGRPVAEVLPACAEFFARLLQEQGESSTRELTCTVGRQRLLLAANFSLLRDAAGQSEGAIAVLRDVTAQRALEQRVQRQDKLSAMGQLASGVAHEIRNPMNAIGILAQRLDLEFAPQREEAEYRQLVRTIVAEVRRVNDIIQRFLQFARPARLHLQPVALAPYLSRHLTAWQNLAAAAGLRFESHLECAGVVHLDGDQMQQVLLNLVRNAVEATPAGGTITLSCHERDGHALVAVTDTGAGIAPADLPHLFDLYFTTKSEGTGMGLSVAQQIVQAHGGVIEVDSEAGKGSEFRILIPLAPAGQSS